MNSTQTNRGIEVKTPLGNDLLLAYRMTARERLGRPFEIDLDALSQDPTVAVEDLLGKTITVAISRSSGTPRYFNGHVSQCAWVGMQGRLAKYQITMVPWLWLLTRNADCRIFQQKSIPDIIKEVFRGRGFSDFQDKLKGTYEKLEYCVQYRESDYNFVSRLMEHAGIYYYFLHEQSKHSLVLADSASSHSTAPGYAKFPFFPPEHGTQTRECISHWSVSHEVSTGKYELNDFDFERPKADLTVKSKIARKHDNSDFEVFDYPGQYVQSNNGQNYVDRRIEELQSQYQRAQGFTNSAGIHTGARFEISGLPRKDLNVEYLVTSSTLDVQVSEYEGGVDGKTKLECRFETIKAAEIFRSARQTPCPVIQGPQTAVVVGKSGEEIWTDKYGRVKVQFHWDRMGKSDENSSCWVRVAQVWAGKTWGAMHIPRIGQEVVVEFLEGDPDRPLITGRVYNADQMPPFPLPDNQTQSGMRTRSTKGGTAATFNELRFEDKKDHEHIYFHAEKDFERVVENNDTLKVGFDKKDAGDQKIEIHNNQTITVGNNNSKDGSQTITVWQNQKETVKKGDVTVALEKGSRKTTIFKDENLTLKTGNQTIKISAGGQSTEAAQSITLKVGASSIKIEPACITMSAPTIKIAAQAQLKASGAMADVSGSGMLKLSGALVKIN